MNLPYLSWASQSAMSNSEGVPVILPHHQAAPTLPLDQSCLPEESASATRAHSSNSRSSNSHHSSPTFSNTMPEFMESVIDSVSATFTSPPPRRTAPPLRGCSSAGSPQQMRSLPVSAGVGADQTGLHPVRAPQLCVKRGHMLHPPLFSLTAS